MFSERYGRIYIEDGEGKTFSCSTSDFLKYAPLYVPVRKGEVRYWDNLRQYLISEDNQKQDYFYSESKLKEYEQNIDYYYSLYAASYPEDDEVPTIYLYLAISGGDGKTPIGFRNDLPITIIGDLRQSPESVGLPIEITTEWRITIRKIISTQNMTPVNSVIIPVQIINNIFTIEDFQPIGWEEGTYLISDYDFDQIDGEFGLSELHKIKILNPPIFLKVLPTEVTQ